MTGPAPDALRKFYEAEAQHVRFHPEQDPRERARVRLVQRLWPRRITTAIDVGCGDGFLCSEWVRHRMVQQVHGSDWVRERVRRAQQAVPTGQFSVQNNYALGFGDAQFDLVSLVETVEHLERPLEALREAARVTRQYVLVTVPYRENTEADRCLCPHCLRWLHPAGHLHSFDEAILSTLFADAGLRVRSLRIQCYLRIMDQHPLCRWMPAAVQDALKGGMRRAGLIQGSFLGVLGERG